MYLVLDTIIMLFEVPYGTYAHIVTSLKLAFRYFIRQTLAMQALGGRLCGQCSGKCTLCHHSFTDLTQIVSNLPRFLGN